MSFLWQAYCWLWLRKNQKQRKLRLKLAMFLRRWHVALGCKLFWQLRWNHHVDRLHLWWSLRLWLCWDRKPRYSIRSPRHCRSTLKGVNVICDELSFCKNLLCGNANIIDVKRVFWNSDWLPTISMGSVGSLGDCSHDSCGYFKQTLRSRLKVY